MYAKVKKDDSLHSLAIKYPGKCDNINPLFLLTHLKKICMHIS